MQKVTKFFPKLFPKLLQSDFFGDARHFQIATLGTLLSLLLLWSDFAPAIEVIVFTMAGTIITQLLFFKFLKIPSNDYRSPFITGLSLCLLFKTNLIWLYPLIGALAMASKFLIRVKGKHIFNPANIAIVLGLVLLPENVWISPGQWGSAIWLGFALVCLAVMVLNRSGRADMALFFFGSWAFFIFGRAFWLGDPLSIPIHNMQSGALLIFAFFMISDPMTTPNHRGGRFIFAFIVASIAYILQYEFQVREAIFYALFITCFSTPILDYLLKDQRYYWRKTL
jgi:Na+-transporting NADH:ubiquinone oxidoreductase subunit NqrB